MSANPPNVQPGIDQPYNTPHKGGDDQPAYLGGGTIHALPEAAQEAKILPCLILVRGVVKPKASVRQFLLDGFAYRLFKLRELFW